MKKIIFILFLFFFLGKTSYSHDGEVHQWILQQAFYLLEKEYVNEGGNISDLTAMRNEIFTNFNTIQFGDTPYQSNPWMAPYTMTVGVFREDVDDPIYQYTTPSPTVTHFWDADNGDDAPNNLTFSPNVPNAWTKARKYINGNSPRVWIQDSYSIQTNLYLGDYITFTPLIDYFIDGYTKVDGYLQFPSYIHWYQKPINFQHDLTTRKKIGFQMLARICHLLADMSVPAHVHVDEHSCILGTADCDTYENVFFTRAQANALFGNIGQLSNFSGDGGFLPYEIDNSDFIRKLFYTMNQLADYFPTDDYSGDNIYNGTNSIIQQKYDLLNWPQSMTNNYSNTYNYNVTIANSTVPFCIGATASLLYWFGVKTNQFHTRINEKQIISSNTIWTGTNYDIGKDIHVTNNSTLTIIGSQLSINCNNKIVVHPGSKLILDGCTLTNSANCSMWKGIEVKGIMNQPISSTFNSSYHGIVELKNNATIKNAIIGINNNGRGIIYMNGANFINNQKAIVMNEPSGNIVIDRSYFKNGNFITNQLYQDFATYPFQYFLELNNSYKLRISGCKFENNLPVTNQYANSNGIGIKSYNAVYTVCDECNNPEPMQQGDPCPAQYTSFSEFINLNYGIYASNFVKTRNITIKNTIFENNYRGIYTDNMDNASFTQNTFKIPEVTLQPYNQVSYDGAYGMYLMDCSGYTVEANLFDKTNNAQWASVGIIINNSGNALNSIYNNTFKNIRYAATLAQNDNTNSDYNFGLKIKCNDYINNKQDIAVVHSQSGISKWQGAGVSNSNDLLKDRKPAGNRFSKIITTGTPDFDNDMGQNITYFHHNDQGNPSNIWVPQYCSPVPKITPNNVLLASFNKALSCPAIAAAANNIQPNYLPNLMQDFAQNTLNFNSAKLILQIWVDGGNSEGLKQTVKLAYPWEAYELYNNLISKSPYLSDEVLIDAIKREEVLPPLMLKLVLLANPQAVRSERVMEVLFNRNNPFPDEWIDELKQGLEVISPREELEADVSYYAGERKTYLDLLKQYYLADTSASAMQNLQQLLSAESDFDSRYELVFAKIANNEFTAANTLLENMEAVLPEDEAEINRYYKMRELIPFVIQLYSGSTEWENIDQSRINKISESEGEDLPASIARAIRLQFDESYTYAEPIYVNESLESKSTSATKINRNKAIDNKQSLKISPNPANEFIVISYELSKAINGLRLVIYDANGKTVYDKELNKAKDELLITLKDYAKGKYVVTLFNNGKVVNSSKMVIQ